MTFNAMGGPQLDEERTFQLARYHIRAFFYWITFNHSTRIGRFWMGCFAPIAVIQKQDWGNPQMRGFQDLIATWDYRVHAIGADEFFKIVIRRSPDDRPLWAWALEWNCNHRLIGFFGDGNAAQAAFDQLPRLKCAVLHTGPTSFVTSRVEVALPEVEDRLFSTPDGGDATGSVANC